jgi:phosphoglycerate dehydrogenase-like enzyme
VRIWYPKPLSEDAIEELAALLPGHTVSRAPHVDTELMIDGRATPEQVAQCPGLKFLVIPYAGLAPTTAELALKNPQISLHNLHHNAPDTAELAIGLLFAAAKQVVPMDQALREGDWRPGFSSEGVELLHSKTALLLGYGEIGKRISAVLTALGMETIAVRRTPGPGEYATSDLPELLPKASVLMITIPLTTETKGLIGSAELAAMPRGSILVNVARGPIVDERALFEALRSGQLHSAGLDVWYQYPQAEGPAIPGYYLAPPSAANTLPANLPFAELPNVVMSPHRGGTTAGIEGRRMKQLAELIRAAANGGPVPNRVDPTRGY